MIFLKIKQPKLMKLLKKRHYQIVRLHQKEMVWSGIKSRQLPKGAFSVKKRKKDKSKWNKTWKRSMISIRKILMTRQMKKSELELVTFQDTGTNYMTTRVIP